MHPAILIQVQEGGVHLFCFFILLPSQQHPRG